MAIGTAARHQLRGRIEGFVRVVVDTTAVPDMAASPPERPHDRARGTAAD